MGIMNRGWGVKHWLFQRFSNFMFIVFGVGLLCTLMSAPDYPSLVSLFDNALLQLFLFVVLLLAIANSVLAGWQIAGDYSEKFNVSQNLIVGLVAVIGLVYLITGLKVIF